MSHEEPRSASADTPHRSGVLLRAGRRWRLWLPALLLGSLAIAIAQAIEHHFFMDLPMVTHHIVSGVLQAIVVAVPVVLYIVWRRAADREKEALRRLQASEALRDDLTHMLVHDLKGPLAAATAVLRLVADKGSSTLDETDAQMLSIALRSQDRLARMIETILDVARAEAGDLLLSATDCDLGGLVRDAVAEAVPSATEAGLTLKVNCDTAISIYADCDKIRRVIDNLLSNAIKYSPSGETVLVSVSRGDGVGRVVVQDAGPGVQEHLRDRIFDKFAQAEAARDGRKMSVGLGLTFCKLMVEAHGGRIWVDDAQDGGSAFTFVLPLSEGKGDV